VTREAFKAMISNGGEMTTAATAPADEVHYVFRDTSLGLALVAATTRGVRAVLLGTDRDDLSADLARRVPAAQRVAGGWMAAHLADDVARAIEAPGSVGDLPLDLAGTSFQREVWHALARIPAGATASYTELAAALGIPKAVRAVARACGANSIAVIVPCHRAVRSDGMLAGYRWGVERKRELLRREGGMSGSPVPSVMPVAARAGA
jgi:AraC family transcriptional regulator of adaptative response/methylated-DNA-[protein]-cysteine methyltransferase